MKAKRIAVFVTAGSLLGPAAAQAHISLHPNTIPAGAFATLDVRVPGEQEGAHVTKVDVLFPAGFTDVDYESVPGWNAKVIDRKLATPIHDDGETIDTEVEQIVWSWTGPLGKVDNGQFIQFPLSVSIPDDASGKALEFRTAQSYSDGLVVHWIDPSLSAEHPSPRINVTAKGGVIEDLAGDEAGPAPGETGTPQQGTGPSAAAPAASASTTNSGAGASEGLGVLALVLGALGLLAGLVALARPSHSGSGRSAL
jgi:periplasmic copper chaperone A